MHCLPSIRALVTMSPENRFAALGAFARDIRSEIAGLQDGSIYTTSGKTVAGELRNSRKRLARVYAAANRFGDYVGQPD